MLELFRLKLFTNVIVLKEKYGILTLRSITIKFLKQLGHCLACVNAAPHLFKFDYE